MLVTRRGVLASAAVAAALPLGRAQAQAPTLKVGCLTDLSGPYKDLAGPGSIASVQQAIEDFGAAGKSMKVEVVSADHQNKPDVAVGIARKWFDVDQVDMIVDVPNSGVGLAVAGVCKEKDKVYINTGSATSDLTGPQCAPTTIHWSYDTYMLAKSTGGAMVKNGGDSWFFVTADYAFGHALQRDTSGFVTAEGGKVIGSITYPFPGTTDFSSMLVRAQASGAKVLGLASAGTDTINQIKQAKEFGLTMRLAGLLMFITDVHSLGLDVAQGLVLTNSYYWDMNDNTRKFGDAFAAKMPGKRPSMVQAGTYAGTLHYLKVASDMGVAEAKKSGAATVERMKATPTEDNCFGKASIRADGVVAVQTYLWEVKKPSESKKPWDYYKLIATTPADQAFRPLDQTGCPLVRS